MIRHSLIVDGRVQGVGFRFFSQMAACDLNLTGWVKNLYDGRVEIEVQGTEENVDKFITRIKKGSGFSKVTNITLNNIPLVLNEKKYSITY